jgi:predicted anti-sigma-YlaC factor YlaD
MKPCNAVQEAIAWSRTLEGEAQGHLLDCERCRAFLEQIAALDARMHEHAEVDVPTDFADRVMANIAERAMPGRSRRNITARSLEIALANFGLVLGVTNVVRFVLAMLVPSIALGGPR